MSGPTSIPPDPVPYTIIGGYLGAGKTTLINRLLRHNAGQRLALLINDFGAINIDASLIAQRTDSQINLTNGCICCGLSAGFDEAIEQMLAQDPAPDHIIVEASGVADVVSLAQYGHSPGLTLNGVLVLADAETVRNKAADKYVADTVQRQLKGADLLVLNKTDLVSADTLGAVQNWLRELTPATPLILTDHCDVPTDVLLSIEPGEHPRNTHASHEDYATWHFQHEPGVSRLNVDAFIRTLPATVLRAKGYFLLETGERLLFQQVGRRKTLEVSATVGPTQLVVIGLKGHLSVETLNECAVSLIGAS